MKRGTDTQFANMFKRMKYIDKDLCDDLDLHN
jgi:hypothetical protein